MPEPTPVVFVVEDDSSVREALAGLIRSAGWNVEVFASAHEFLARPRIDAPGCLVLDVGLPGLSGLDLQARLLELGSGGQTGVFRPEPFHQDLRTAGAARELCPL